MEKYTVKQRPTIRIESSFKWYKRLWTLIKNPITYLFGGYIEY